MREEEKGREASRMTYTIPEAGRILGIGRNSAYEAARRGEIPVIRIGGRIVVPVAALEHMLGGSVDRGA